MKHHFFKNYEKHLWHPCSQMQDYEKFKSIGIIKGQGVWLETITGDKILDAISSWWVNLFGHANSYIAKKISEQAHTLEHVIFANFSHEPALKLAHNLSNLFEHQLPKVFYAENGSSAVEIALKMSFQYHQQTGEKRKTKFIYISGAYHGETIGALSVGSLGLYKKIYEPILLDTIEVPGPDCYRCPLLKNRNNCQAECFIKTQKAIEKEADYTSAIIIEPILQAASGMRMYPSIYLQKLEKLAKKFNIHLIVDEIASGFGRTGKMMASHHAGIIPDFVTVSKGLTGGFLPLSAVLTNQKIYNAFLGDYTQLKAFMHSHSYTANPLACASANATFEIFEKEDILVKINNKGLEIYNQIKDLESHSNVGEIRNIGMVTAIELVKNKSTKEPFDWKKRIGYQIYQKAIKKGLLLRPLGDIIYFMPPYIINTKEIQYLTSTTKDLIKDHFS